MIPMIELTMRPIMKRQKYSNASTSRVRHRRVLLRDITGSLSGWSYWRGSKAPCRIRGGFCHQTCVHFTHFAWPSA
jgi:hypothetical protein